MALAKLTKKIARDSGFVRDGKPLSVILEPGGEIIVKVHGSNKKQSIKADDLYDFLLEKENASEPVANDQGTELVNRVIELLPTAIVGDGEKANYEIKVVLAKILERIKSERDGTPHQQPDGEATT